MSHHNDTDSRAAEQLPSTPIANEPVNSPIPVSAYAVRQPDEFDLLAALVEQLRTAAREDDDRERAAHIAATIRQELHVLTFGWPEAGFCGAYLTRQNGRIAPVDERLAAELQRIRADREAMAREPEVVAADALTELATQGGVDFAEVACNVITTVTANVGGVDALLSTRSGSWEAVQVYGIVTSTAGDDPNELHRFRTAPLHLYIDPEGELYEAGVLDHFDEACLQVEQAFDEAYLRMLDASITPEERAHDRFFRKLLQDQGLGIDVERFEEHAAMVKAVEQRAKAAATPEYLAFAAVKERYDSAEARRQAELDAFLADYVSSVRAELEQRGLTCGFELVEAIEAPSLRDETAAEVDEASRHAALKAAQGRARARGEGRAA